MRNFYLILILFICQLSFAQTRGNKLYNDSSIHVVRLNFTQPGYWDSLVQNYTLDVYMQCNVTVDDSAFGQVGVKFKGNSSYRNPSTKKSFKIGIDEFVAGQTYDGIEKFNLNNGFKDPSFLREKLMLDFLRQQGLPAPRCAFAKVYINGSYWGLYDLVEEVNKDFLKDHFSNKDGNLFKGDPSGSLEWRGPMDSSYYRNYELKTNETANDWSDLVRLIDRINNTPSGNFHDSLERVLNTDNYIGQWASLLLFVNLDSYMGSGHNYYLYHNTDSDQFDFISWDVNEAFGNFNYGMTTTQLKELPITYIPTGGGPGGGGIPQRPLNSKMLANTSYINALATRICDFIQYDFSNEALDTRIDSLVNQIRDAVYTDTKKFYSNTNFESNINSDVVLTGPGGTTCIGIKPFIRDRRNFLFGHLASYGCRLNTSIPQTEADNRLQLYPNPTADKLFIRELIGTSDYEIMDMQGRVLLKGNIDPLKNEMDVRSLMPGLYVVKLMHQGRQEILRFMRD